MNCLLTLVLLARGGLRYPEHRTHINSHVHHDSNLGCKCGTATLTVNIANPRLKHDSIDTNLSPSWNLMQWVRAHFYAHVKSNSLLDIHVQRFISTVDVSPCKTCTTFNDDKVCSCVPGWFGSEFRAFLCETDADDASCVRWCALEFTTAGTSEGQRISWRLIVDIVADPLLRQHDHL